jgi:hypothetical protein
MNLELESSSANNDISVNGKKTIRRLVYGICFLIVSWLFSFDSFVIYNKTIMLILQLLICGIGAYFVFMSAKSFSIDD